MVGDGMMGHAWAGREACIVRRRATLARGPRRFVEGGVVQAQPLNGFLWFGEVLSLRMPGLRAPWFVRERGAGRGAPSRGAREQELPACILL